jgi:cystathionine beta-lyase
MDFDEVVDRSGTFSLKWDNPKNAPGLPDIIPLWVADMDFPPPEAVLEAVRARAAHPIYGYTRAPLEYAEAVSRWCASRQGLDPEPAEILMAPSVMPAISAAIQAFTNKSEGVMIMPPVYHPFFKVVEENGRALVEAPLARSPDGAWSMDFEGMERAAARAEAAGTRLSAILVSSPHNPVGRVWSRPELDELLHFARRKGAAILCDEIHSDIILGERAFASMAAYKGKEAEKVLVFGGPNKTFNIAGLHICHAIARDTDTRLAMKKAISAWGFGLPNAFSLAAALAAYRAGGPWLDELLTYLRKNYGFLVEFLSDRLPGILAGRVEGSYLAWLDARSLLGDRRRDADDAALVQRLEDFGRVKVSPGSGFGREGGGYLRLNFACPRSILAEGLERITRTLE